MEVMPMKKLITIAICLVLTLSVVGCGKKSKDDITAPVMDGITVKVTEVIDSGSCNVVVDGGNSAFSSGDTLTIHYNNIRENGSDYTDPLKNGDLIAVTYENIDHSDDGYSISVEYVDLIETVEIK
jgi:hypothetical protein